jgi:light-regulated signal transduction histidine kinase (bacteriophytochrome)
MLEGFDETWNEIGINRSATYTNLDPAKYVFRVKGLNSEGVWSSRNIAVQLIITPPFWLTWWFRISVILVFIGVIVAIYTYRVRAIKAQREKLQKLVKAQTRLLSQSAEEEHRAREEAEEVNKELERKNKELEQFAYVASHDMQEPLRTTASFIDLLQKQYRGKLDEKADKYFTYVLQSSERMKTLIQDLLDYSRIGRKQEREQVDCNAIMQDVVADLAIAIRENNAIIQYDALPVIWGHATEIKLLFQNLVMNAIKFRRKDVEPQVKIAAVKAGEYWRFSCSDNGIGIDEKHGERIFIIFQRLHNRNEYNGSGIGLAHCKKIVELHGGRIWFESTPGAGTTFYFTLRTKPDAKATPVVPEISE